jgi:hypothetical protein
MARPRLLESPVEQKFQQLVSNWKTSSAVSSSLTQMFAEPSYRELIALGEPAVPLLLAELEREPDWWFAALKAITAADPVAPDHRGKLVEMTRAWLDWGKAQGYRW